MYVCYSIHCFTTLVLLFLKYLQIDKEAAQLKADYEAFVVESKAKIEKIKTDMAAWENMKPIEHMTCEEVLAYPQLADHPVIQAHIQNPDKPRHR